jgi:hypothetical protein
MRVAAALSCALVVAACNDGNRVAERVSCYPACLADVVQRCPIISACQTADTTNAQISDVSPNVAIGTAACFASGEKKWQAVNAMTSDSYVAVKARDGGECYTAISAGATLRYTISVGGHTLAELNADTQGGATTVTCNGTTTEIEANDHCALLPWTATMTCDQGPCDFGALPPGAATDATTN